jgi:hypothetical protein
MPRAADDADPTKVVDRWLNEVVHQGVTDRIEEFVSADVVVVLHGLGANEDGTPRRLEGLAAVRDWHAQVTSRHAAPPELRIDNRLVDGNKVAVRGLNVWTWSQTRARSSWPNLSRCSIMSIAVASISSSAMETGSGVR